MPRLVPLTLALALAVSVAGAAAGRPHTPSGRMLGMEPLHVSTRASAAPEPLTWHGGPVLHHSTAYALFWSPSSFPMPTDYVATMTKYFQDQQASSAGSGYAVAGQYFDASGPADTSSAFGGAFVQADPPPANQCTDTPVDQQPTPIGLCVNQTTLSDLASRTVAARGVTSADAIFFVFLPPGMGTCSDSGRSCAYAQFAAYHANTRNGTAYAVIPYFADPPFESVAHEHVETITDPDGGAWYTNRTQEEVADICVGRGKTQQTLGTTSYLLPLEWSNAEGRCSDKAPAPTTTLALRARGVGGGDVKASFDGQLLTCGATNKVGDCVTAVRRGARVTLTATPDDSSAFGRWDARTPCATKTRARCIFTSGTARTTATASFVGDAGVTFLLSVDVAGKGTVVMPNGRRCRTSCVQTVPGAKAITLTAVPDKGWKLKTMRDDTRTCGARPRCTVSLHDSDNVFATFVRR